MTEERWREIMSEVGYTESQMDSIREGRPLDEDIASMSEKSIRYAAELMLPLFNIIDARLEAMKHSSDN